MKIEGAVCLVTGAAGGLGRPIAELLLARGAIVAAADCQVENLPAGACPCRMDVTDPASVRDAVAGFMAEYGCIGLLVNCAGRIVSAPFLNIMNPDGMMLPYEKFRSDLLVNLDSVFIVTAAVVEQMARKRLKGCVVNISSISARGNEGQTSYSAAKAAVEAMTVTWSRELGRFGIRCNAVAPGFIDTPSTHSALNEGQIRHIVDNTPLRRLGRPQEVAQAVLSLAENDFLNGVILDVNGGLRI